MTYILDQILPEDLISLLEFKHNVVVHDVETRRSVSVNFPFVENYLECMHKFEVNISFAQEVYSKFFK